jgi:hypothetical protein
MLMGTSRSSYVSLRPFDDPLVTPLSVDPERAGVCDGAFRCDLLPPKPTLEGPSRDMDLAGSTASTRTSRTATPSWIGLPSWGSCGRPGAVTLGAREGSAQWVDLDGEGLPGLLLVRGAAGSGLTSAGGSAVGARRSAPLPGSRGSASPDVASPSPVAWTYLGNEGSGRLRPPERRASQPSLAAGLARPQLVDPVGDGRLRLVTWDDPVPGTQDRNADGTWGRFRPFKRRPNVALDDPNLRFLDLDGDGRPDQLLTEQTAFRWHPSLGLDGFGPAETTAPPKDPTGGPSLVFDDGTESIFLADMAGD